MKHLIRQAVLYCTLLLAGISFAHAQQAGSGEPQIVFRFVAGNDMFYIPWNGNGTNLDSLCNMLDPCMLNKGSVRVDGYGSTKELVLTRCNRIKSELILRRGLTEEHFITTMRSGSFNGMRHVVVVTIPNFKQKPGKASMTTEQEQRQEQEQPAEQQQSTVAEKGQETPKGETPVTEVLQNIAQPVMKEEPSSIQTDKSLKPISDPWSAGLNIGVPFFWGDMISMSAGKTYIGFAIGIQGSYRISKLLTASLSLDYAKGKIGAQDYSEEYLLAPDGQTWYTPQEQTLLRYADLYSKVSLVNVGLSIDININRLFCKQADKHRFTAWISPTVYGQFFSADIYTKTDDKRYSDGSTKSNALSLGLGGTLALRYRINHHIDLQLKNSIAWITDNHFDAIRIPFSKARQNALWLPQLGIVWNIK